MLRTALLLTVSNIFMTFAWYGHLKHTGRALWVVILLSWGIALFEYSFQVPANRYGYLAGMSAAQLKTLQEVITLVVFVAFAALYLREPVRWNVIMGFILIAAGAALVYGPWTSTTVADLNAPAMGASQDAPLLDPGGPPSQ